MSQIAYPPDAPPATRLRRFFGHILDALLIALLLVVGWLIWLYFSAKNSQSPAKQLLGMYIITTDGRPASAGRVWIREALLQWLIFGNILIAAVVDFLFFLFDDNAQSLHDKIVETAVVRPVTAGAQAGPALGPNWDAARPAETPQTQPPSPPPIPQARPHQASRQEKLRELEELANKGLITVREYRDRRQRILDEMDAE